ncbi:RagB/SusD family nutrient uptake outer membrane protein [Mariniphaga sediminis]|uniref:RagB/SusD family nutrient uptake outer membrane protein n=1 Tax=Mariniphaga sediminis TaxID=1628158 RepID=A0A399CZB0_9BACT|nr:RagB/SusD family nutrient uptake outer membrane protein [Mariniphaga sediminis]RIH64483.1 RagB/SusD family nutrient uptake outer membrane protein [Mariniphaga sediminis]
MKKYLKSIWLLFTIIILTITSCTEYLDKTIEADITEKDVFSSFNTFQGYVETLYDDVVEWVHLRHRFGEFNWGDDIIPTRKAGFIEGDYFYVMGSGMSPYYNTDAQRDNQPWYRNLVRRHGIWQNSWYGIRAANISLKNLPMLVDATDEQRRLIEGQAYFFRGYFHWEMMKAWGAVPYVDTVFNADDDMRIAQLGLHETVEKVVSDLERAEELLPLDWDNIDTGELTKGFNAGRATRGMALAVKAECLMYAASPLFNGVATGNYNYNSQYCERAAEAAWQIIQLADQGVYQLEPWETYSQMFFTKDNSIPRSKEIIFKAPNRGNTRYFSSSFTFGHVGTDNWYSAPSHNYVKRFEMANGLPVEDPESGYNPNDPFNKENRDPRFAYNILVDGDRIIKSLADDRAFVQFYVGGRERTSSSSRTGYGYRKYWDETINRFDRGWNNYFFEIPKLRLAEIYLIYAECANEAYGPNGSYPGANFTAVEAVNMVRNRALMPGVHQKFLQDKEVFRERIRNERAVELAYESKRWYDLRRWHVAHQPEYRKLTGLNFDKEHTYFEEVVVETILFSEKHYWLPFPVSQVNLYPEWKQNPGW